MRRLFSLFPGPVHRIRAGKSNRYRDVPSSLHPADNPLHSNPHPFRRFLMNYVDATIAPLRKTGQIKLHGAEAFEHMRRAGRLVVECLDMLVPEVRPGVSTERIN